MEEGLPKPPVSLRDKILSLEHTIKEAYKRKPISHWIVLALSTAAVLISCVKPSNTSNGGESKWIISWMAVAGWSLTALILFPSYFFVDSSPTPPTFKLLVSYIVLGFLSAADNLMYAYAYAYLPASIAALLASSFLVFSALCLIFSCEEQIESFNGK